MTACDAFSFAHEHGCGKNKAAVRACWSESMETCGSSAGPHRRPKLGGKVWVRVVTGSFSTTHTHTHTSAQHGNKRGRLTGSTHVFEQGSNVGCHQQYSRALCRCQLPCHGSSSQVGLGLARRTSEVGETWEDQQTQAGKCVSKLLTRLGICQRSRS